jgi:hypothetical protein
VRDASERLEEMRALRRTLAEATKLQRFALRQNWS